MVEDYLVVLDMDPAAADTDVVLAENDHRHFAMQAPIGQLIDGKEDGNGHPGNQQKDKKASEPVFAAGVLADFLLIDCVRAGWRRVAGIMATYLFKYFRN